MGTRISGVILNRNLGTLCDELRSELISQGVNDVVIVDSSTDVKLQSKYATVCAENKETLEKGFRINRGFNAGIHFSLNNIKSDWILCLPVDTEIIKLDIEKFLQSITKFPKIVAFPLLEINNPYLEILENDTGLVWNIPEGPILLKADFLQKFQSELNNTIFDDSNFRGYLSFKDLALKIYGSNFGVGINKNFLINEREDLLLNFSDLMQTEELNQGKKLLIEEGKIWLFNKYGFRHRWELENLLRLSYEEFVLKNPGYLEISI